MIIFASIILLHCTAGEILQQPIRSKNKDFVMEFQTQKYECTNQILNTKGRGWDSGILCYDPSLTLQTTKCSQTNVLYCCILFKNKCHQSTGGHSNERMHVFIGVGFGEVNTRFWSTFPSFRRYGESNFVYRNLLEPIVYVSLISLPKNLVPSTVLVVVHQSAHPVLNPFGFPNDFSQSQGSNSLVTIIGIAVVRKV